MPRPRRLLHGGQEKNDTALHEQGVERRQMDAAAIHDRLDTPEAGSLASVELEVVEVPKPSAADVGGKRDHRREQRSVPHHPPEPGPSRPPLKSRRLGCLEVLPKPLRPWRASRHS